MTAPHCLFKTFFLAIRTIFAEVNNPMSHVMNEHAIGNAMVYLFFFQLV